MIEHSEKRTNPASTDLLHVPIRISLVHIGGLVLSRTSSCKVNKSQIICLQTVMQRISRENWE